MNRLPHYHISFHGPNNVWPKGVWSLYQITGDEIAERIKFNKDGIVTQRLPWCGYLGSWATLPEIVKAIEEKSE